MRVGVHFISFLVLLMGYQSVVADLVRPLNVFGASDFSPLSYQPALAGVGTIKCSRAGFISTGFLVSPDKILTVAHLFYNKRGRRRGGVCRFYPKDGRQSYAIKKLTVGSTRPHQQNHLDYAAAKLSKPVSNFPPLPPKVFTEGDIEQRTVEYHLAGYHPRKDKMVMSSNCSPVAKSNTEYLRADYDEELIHSSASSNRTEPVLSD